MAEFIYTYFYLILSVIIIAAIGFAMHRQKTTLADFRAMNQKSLDAVEESMANQRKLIQLTEEQNALLKKLTDK